MTATLYGVGLGPGDPELMTLKAYRLIAGAGVIAYPAPDSGDSFARAIAADVIPAGAEEIPMVVPMRAARAPARAIYDAAAPRLAAHLSAGRDVVVLCEGDPFFYGSFMYLFERLGRDHATQIVPGVASMTACAAALRRPLCARNDALSVIPATLPEDAFRTRLASADAAAIMKVGRRLPMVRRVIGELGLTDRAGYVERATLPEQIAVPLDRAPDTAPYFSMILIYKGGEAWTL